MPSSSIAAGMLTRRVTVERITSGATIDASGHVDESVSANWEVVRRLRKCMIVPASSREFIVGDQLNQQVTHQITMRMDSESTGYNSGNRLKYGDRVFNLAGPGINVNEDDVLMAFPAVEVKL